MKILWIIRGAPGSGKSTLAKHILFCQENVFGNTAHWYEADMFFTDHYGNYKYVPRLIPCAHQWCQKKTKEAMQQGVENVIVSNVFAKQEHIQPYRDMAAEHGYIVQEILCMGKFQNVHKVPEDKVEQIRKSIQIY